MKPSELKDLVKSRHTAGLKRPIFAESSPGLGKTQIASQAAKELGVGFKAIHAPLLLPEDYGLPVLDKAKSDVDFVVSKDKFPVEGADCPEHGIFLIDELSQADNNAQKILANLIQEREIHGKYLKKGWSVVATGNRQKDRAGANRILGHLGNRITRVQLDASLDDWTKWAIENDIKTEVISFIRFRPELLSNYDPGQEINATPRSWAEGVSAAIGVVPPHLEFPVFVGDVGEGPASEFLAFLNIYRKLPDPDEILKDPKKVKVPSDPATLYAICGALSSRVTDKTFGKALIYIRRMPPEFSVLFIRDVTTKDPELMMTKEYLDWVMNEGKDLIL